MSHAIAIADLAQNAELDRDALQAVSGRGYGSWHVTNTSTLYSNKLISSQTVTIFGVGYRKKTYETKKKQTGYRYHTSRRTELSVILPF